MAKEIGRLHSFAIGTETTAGTAGTIDAWIPLESGNLKPVVEVIKDESGFGNIASPADAHMAKVSSEFSAKGIVRPTSFGWLLLTTLGAAAAPTLLETGVYSHAFTVANTNAHPSFTVIHDDQTQEESAVYHMVDSLTIMGEVGQYVKFDLKSKGRLQTSTTGNTPSFATTGETPFLVSKASVKFATDVAGLAGASRVAVQNFKMTIDKNLEQIFSTMSSATEGTDFATQHNKNLNVKGDFEIVYDANTYKALAVAGTKQAIEINVESRVLLGATKYESITIQLASVVLEDWDRSDDKDGIVTQSFGFTGMYKLAETKMVTATLQNARATQYA